MDGFKDEPLPRCEIWEYRHWCQDMIQSVPLELEVAIDFCATMLRG
jgi:hypothetical protein